MFKKFLLLFLFLLFVTPVFAEDDSNDKTRGFQITEEEKNLPEWGPYMDNMERKIRNNWMPSTTASIKKVVCRFTIEKDGSVSDINIVETGGEDNDKAAIDAIKTASPFDPLPEKYKGGSITTDFTLDYNPYIQNNIDNLKSEVKEISTPITKDEYIIQARQKIMSNWKPKTYSEYASAEVTVGKNGELLGSKIIYSEGSKEAKAKVLETIKNSAPFNAFPESIKTDSVKFIVRLIY